MYQSIRSVIPAILLSICTLQPAHADETSITSVQVFKKAQDAISFAEEKGKILHPIDKQFNGYSLQPFGSREKAYAEALEKAEKSGESFLYVAADRDAQFSSPPPGSFMSGTYRVITFNSVSMLDLTAENLLSELKYGAFHAHLLGYARKAEFKDLTKNYREMIRAGNYEKDSGLGDLTQLIILHEGKSCADDLIKWSKFHKNSAVRLAS